MRSTPKRLCLSIAGVVATLLAIECVYRADVYGWSGFSVEAMNSMATLGKRSLVTETTDPELRYVLRPNAEILHKLVTIRTNSRGLRDEEVELEPPPGALRIAVLGDSFTMGQGVELEDTFHTVLERNLTEELGREVQCVSFGVGGYSLTDYSALVDRHIGAFSPDLVLVGLCFNDQYPPEYPGAGRYVAPPALPSFFRLHFLDALFERMQRVEDEPATAGIPEDAAPEGTARWKTPGWEARKRDFVREHFLRIRDACRREGWGLLFVHLHFEETMFGARAGAVYADVARQLGVPFLDTLDAFPDRPVGYYQILENDRHPNAEAHGIFERAIAERLRGGIIED